MRARSEPPFARAVRPRAWSDLRPRILSAVVIAPVVLVCVWLGGLVWSALVLAGAVGMALECLALCRRLPAARGAAAVAGLACIGAAGGVLLWLRADPVAGRVAVLFVLLVVWASDVGAYATGRWIGGPRLAPLISPAKTWAGAAGGLLAACLAGVGTAAAISAASISASATVHAAQAGAALGLAAQCGDLLESAAKRAAGVKDSGRLIPGHGGLLDRLDGLLTASLCAGGLAMLAGRGVVFW